MIQSFIKSVQIATIGCFLASFSPSLFGQQDFNNFTTLRAVGSMPADFSTDTRQKIEDDKGTRTQLSKQSEKVFLQGIHYSIDELLHSGLVVYGDEISEYVSKVADHLLKNDRALRSKLRFYTLKSNATNAFSTDQGIIFVTTGLISQLSSESQLAYILAHEISHYTQHHVVETFDFKRENGKYHDRISKLSIYSKDKEFEADKLGIKIYQEAGYNKGDLLGTFDVLLYSYLPFEDVKVPVNYFNTDLAYIPERYFSKKDFEIKAIEDKSDVNSSHPNIKKRKEAAEKEILNFASWGSDRFALGEEKFYYIRNVSRFESVRTDILDARFVDALYSIFILEQQYPNSVYLNKMKAHAWLGFAQIAIEKDTKKAIMLTSQLEGEIGAMHYVFGKINKSAISVLALRYVTDIKNKYPKNKEIEAIWKKLIKTLANTSSFEISKFSTKTFAAASDEFIASKNDTTKTVVQEEKPAANKYEKIKKKKDVNNVENFDSTKFEIYLISDLVASEEFKTLFDNYRSDFDELEKEDKRIQAMTRQERKKYEKTRSATRYQKGINTLIMVEPTAVIIKGRNQVNLEKSRKAKNNMIQSIQDAEFDLDMKFHIMNTTAEFVTSTEKFNNRSRIFSYLEQSSNNESKELMSVDYDDINEIKSVYNTSNVGFLFYKKDFRTDKAWFASFAPPFITSLFGLPHMFATAFKGEFSLVVVDITTGNIVVSKTEDMNDANTKNAVKARIYNVFSEIKKSPNAKK